MEIETLAGGDKMKRLLGDDFFTVDHEKTNSQAPTNADEAAVVAERCRRKLAFQHLRLGRIDGEQVSSIDRLKELDLQIFVAFSVGVPKHGNFHAIEVIDGDSAHTIGGP